MHIMSHLDSKNRKLSINEMWVMVKNLILKIILIQVINPHLICNSNVGRRLFQVDNSH